MHASSFTQATRRRARPFPATFAFLVNATATAAFGIRTVRRLTAVRGPLQKAEFPLNATPSGPKTAFEAHPLVSVSLTAYDPALEYVWVIFGPRRVALFPSPKLQS